MEDEEEEYESLYDTEVVCECCGGEGCPYCFGTGLPPTPDFEPDLDLARRKASPEPFEPTTGTGLASSGLSPTPCGDRRASMISTTISNIYRYGL